MKKTMRFIVVLLSMIVFTTMLTGCGETQEEKFKKIEAELYDMRKEWITSYDKSVETLDEGLVKKAAEKYNKRAIELSEKLIEIAKGNVALQEKADKLKNNYVNHSSDMKRIDLAFLKKAKFKLVSKKLVKLNGDFYTIQENFFIAKDKVGYEKAHAEYVKKATPLAEEMNKIANGDKIMMLDAMSTTKVYERYRDSIKNKDFEQYWERQEGSIHKSAGEEKYGKN